MSVNGSDRDRPSAGTPASAEDAAARGWRASLGGRRRGLWLRLGMVALLFVLIAVSAHRATRATPLPGGRWGAAISCLEHNQTEKIADQHTGSAPTPSTRSVTVTRVPGDVQLAVMRDAGSAAAARAIVQHNRFGEISRADYRTSGPIVWGFDAVGYPPKVSANPADRQLIDFCGEHPLQRR